MSEPFDDLMEWETREVYDDIQIERNAELEEDFIEWDRSRLLTVRSVAEQLAVSESKVRSLLDGRHIEHYRIDGAVRVHPDAVDAYLAGVRQPSRAELSWIP